MASVLDLYGTVSAAWTEGRLENVLQRQKELASLHSNVKKSSASLIKALTQDLQITDKSAAEELQLTLDTIKTLYDSLDFPKSLSQEASIKRGASATDNLVALGPTLIDPSPHSPVASTLAPLAAAVAAGSAVIVLASRSAPTVAAELQRLVKESLDIEAIAVTNDDSADTRHQLGTKFFGVAVLQNLPVRANMLKQLYQKNPLVKILSPPSGISAAFVDRSVQDLEAVSTHLYHAAIDGPRHNPLRIPRLCFVDETLIADLEGLLGRAGPKANESLNLTTGQDNVQALSKALKAKFPSVAKRTAAKSSGRLPAVIALSSSDPLTAESISPVVDLLTESHNGLLLIPTRSLDHGIDILSKLNDSAPSQATYIFGAAKSSFYVAAFSKTLQVFINAIPQWSLVTVAPSSSSVSDSRPLYSREDFSVNKPIIQEPLRPVQEIAIRAKALWPFMSQTLRLGKIKQPKGGRLSYFERGLIVGLALTLVAISGTSVGIHRASQHFFKRV
ncbi:uncharacterized protein NECHADRAFT_87462 [Fusarium vanettenii 77-13-4]|uniref:Aldehyde dehydrogenase domain-containing protein n=1 Tax=Fusarium vanettenii (strain ATCC MYA-4622 / CBS 123669 / FGSC 9596 / NRRL 45880 / 77-13-4) TaxID=660122 RepID=C7ZE68_FUSV7|nr:uncharacterized protein NECHADRAFT_87462 [Fusarium vanettenii 77-13-4]EEU37682.1 hypothetical protein NECHADRAFT_87462 [Fusarium vanettenii 77-13-4]